MAIGLLSDGRVGVAKMYRYFFDVGSMFLDQQGSARMAEVVWRDVRDTSASCRLF